jgi:hypothetical protein
MSSRSVRSFAALVLAHDFSYAEEIAGERGNRGLSLVVSDVNRGARRLYETLRLPRGRIATDGEGRLSQRRTKLASANKGAWIIPPAVLLRADEVIE